MVTTQEARRGAGGSRTISFRMPRALTARIVAEAAARGVTRSTLMVHALATHFRDEAVLAQTRPALARGATLAPGEPKEWEPTHPPQLRLPYSIFRQLRNEANLTGKRRSALLAAILTDAFPAREEVTSGG